MKVIDHKRLAKLMLIQGVTARSLAESAGWKSHSYVLRLTKGEGPNTLKVEPACRIADRLGVGVDDLFLVQTSTETEQIAQRRKTKGQAA